MDGSSDSHDEPKKQSENTAQVIPRRERRLKSLLKSIKLRISDERIEDDDISDNQGIPVPGTMTCEHLRMLLPNLSSRPYSALQQFNWQNAVRKAEEKNERLSSGKNCISDAEKPFVDDMAEPFRKRVQPIPRNYQRSKSVLWSLLVAC